MDAYLAKALANAAEFKKSSVIPSSSREGEVRAGVRYRRGSNPIRLWVAGRDTIAGALAAAHASGGTVHI